MDKVRRRPFEKGRGFRIQAVWVAAPGSVLTKPGIISEGFIPLNDNALD
jgi:hypothetical protein